MAIIAISGKINSGKDTVGQMFQYFYDSKNWGNSVSFQEYEEYIQFKEYRFSKLQHKKFADKLKDIVCLLLNCDRETLENRDFKESLLGPEWNFYRHQFSSTPFATDEEAIKDAMHYRECGDWNEAKIKKIQMTPRKLLQVIGTEAGTHIVHPNIWVNSLFRDYHKKSKYVRESDWVITDMRFPNELEAIYEKRGVSIRLSRDTVISDKEHISETALDGNKDFTYYVDNNEGVRQLYDKIEVIFNEIIEVYE